MRGIVFLIICVIVAIWYSSIILLTKLVLDKNEKLSTRDIVAGAEKISYKLISAPKTYLAPSSAAKSTILA